MEQLLAVFLFEATMDVIWGYQEEGQFGDVTLSSKIAIANL